MDPIDGAPHVGSMGVSLHARIRRLLKELERKRATSGAHTLQPPPANHILHRLNAEELDQQQVLLAAHRRTLGKYLHRRVLFGAADAPPEVTNGIADARALIARVKAILYASGAKAPNHPDDR